MYIFVEQPQGISFDVYDKFEDILIKWEEIANSPIANKEQLLVEGLLNSTRYEVRNLKVDNNNN